MIWAKCENFPTDIEKQSAIIDDDINADILNSTTEVKMASCSNKMVPLLSTTAYHALRTSGFIKWKLHGFQDDVNSQLVEKIQKKMEINEFREFVGLLVDETKNLLCITNTEL